MRRVALAMLLAGGPGQAAETIAVAPPPAWVDATIQVPAMKDGGSPLRLVDGQARYDAAGTHGFTRQVTRITSPEMLQAAGTVGLAWQPATDSVTVHRLTLVRDGKPIDLLGQGKGFTVLRREEGLEQRQIDGRLTAVMTVPDLRVGDEIDFAYTTDSANPVLAGHAEALAVLAGGLAPGRLHLAQSWPAARPLRWRVGEGLPQPTVATRGGETRLTIDRADFALPVLPNGAPGRYAAIGELALSDFADWRQVSATMAPLFDRAAAIPPGGALDAEAKRIAALSPDPAARAAAALASVQGQVRYLADVSGLGGYTPVAAERVWAERRGDCKGKTALLVALLRRLGIDARPVLVSATRPDGVDTALPMPGRFDHVVVAATVAGKTYWLDGTRTGDTGLDRIIVPHFRHGLPLVAGGTGLVAIPATAPTQPDTEWRLDLDARGGITVPARATGTAILRGDGAAAMRQAFGVMDAQTKERMLRKIWTERHDWLTVKTVAGAVDPATGAVQLTFTGEGEMDWGLKGDGPKRYEANKARLGTHLSVKREAGPGADAPIEVAETWEATHQTILLPQGGKGFRIDGEAIDETAGGIRYTRAATLRDGRFDMTAVTRTALHEVSVAEAKAADAVTDKVWNRQLFVAMGDAPRREAQGEAADLALAQKYINEGNLSEALKTLDTAIAASPTADLRARRGEVLRRLGRGRESEQEADWALAMNRYTGQALALKAFYLRQRGRPEDALVLMDRHVLLHPSFLGAYMDRAMARQEAQQEDGALADLDIILSKDPDYMMARDLKQHILVGKGRQAEAIADAEAWSRARPQSAEALSFYADILGKVGRKADATRVSDRALALGPIPATYVVRLRHGLAPDRKAMIDEAVKLVTLDATRTMPAEFVETLRGDKTGYDAIMRAFAAAIAKAPDNPWLVEARAVFAEANGHPDFLIAASDALKAKSPNDPELLNASCWRRATANVELERALADCDAALAIDRRSAMLDSRGMANLRLKRWTQAVADYDASLKLEPRQSSSLYGRAVARAALGDVPGATADVAAARLISAQVEKDYDGYGLKLDLRQTAAASPRP